ncbi:hypothetical protein T484DRAFT_1931356 [Baffinella frigidus]|nr:hypothetical protein T484DRAFT_1931356 [Cryptophyta sp. CCMP2293]
MQWIACAAVRLRAAALLRLQPVRHAAAPHPVRLLDLPDRHQHPVPGSAAAAARARAPVTQGGDGAGGDGAGGDGAGGDGAARDVGGPEGRARRRPVQGRARLGGGYRGARRLQHQARRSAPPSSLTVKWPGSQS